jgi:hypothetical protein
MMSRSPDQTVSDPNETVLNLLEKGGDLSSTGRQVIKRYMTTWSCDALRALTETHILTEGALAERLAEAFQVPLVRGVNRLAIIKESFQILPFQRARDWEMIMVRGEDHARRLVVSCPASLDRIETVRKSLPFGITLSVGERSDIVRAIDELYPLAAQLSSLHGE